MEETQSFINKRCTQELVEFSNRQSESQSNENSRIETTPMSSNFDEINEIEYVPQFNEMTQPYNVNDFYILQLQIFTYKN